MNRDALKRYAYKALHLAQWIGGKAEMDILGGKNRARGFTRQRRAVRVYEIYRRWKDGRQ